VLHALLLLLLLLCAEFWQRYVLWCSYNTVCLMSS
jgi:hypothetical protein